MGRKEAELILVGRIEHESVVKEEASRREGVYSERRREGECVEGEEGQDVSQS